VIHLPTLQHLDVDSYGLFPGTEARPGLHIDFQPGLTIVLGANGLGKTTLVTILYRMLTGPTDIPNIDTGGPLGNRRLDTKTIPQAERRIFSSRVMDDAVDAEATLSFSLAETDIRIKRNMKTLDVLTLVVGDEELEPSQDVFEAIIQSHATLSSFSDWILVLRHLVFYFEDRRALVWDASAQRQLLRLLFLPTDEARRWTLREREILELDSLVRNLQYSLSKEQRYVSRAKRAVGTLDEVRQQLELLQTVQANEQDRLSQANDELTSVSAERQLARVIALTMEQAHESAQRSVEHLQLRSIEAAFPDATTTARYIVGQLLVDSDCLTCGSHVPDYASLLQQRLQSRICPVCGTKLGSANGGPRNIGRSLAKASILVSETEIQNATATTQRESAEALYDELLTEIAGLTKNVARRSLHIKELSKRLPPDERQLVTHETELTTVQSRLEQRREELHALRTEFFSFAREVNEKISQQKEAIKGAFDSYARGFLFENCALVWAPRRSRIGETGEAVAFAAFELDMSGANFASPVRRTGPQHVSESQREFIDLSFRMALMQVASAHGGSLIIDAPESSLDAVFVTRAATVLTRFGKADANNRLIITSNLVDGNLIPELLRRSNIHTSRDSRVVDLLRIAAPTAATRELHADYSAIRTRLFTQARGESELK
jgi:hypothetical protein